MSTLEQQGLVRLRYRRRQLLAGDDLRREVTDKTELQWWHNRAVHDAFGVVSGLETVLLADGEATYVVVMPGLAYDAYGRALELRRRVAIRLPSDEVDRLSGSALLLRAPDEVPVTQPVHRGRRPTPSPELCWAPPGHLAAREGVPLGCVSVQPLAELPSPGGSLPPNVIWLEAARVLVAIGRITDLDLVAALAPDDEVYDAAIRSLYASSWRCPWPRRARRIARSKVVSGTTVPRQTAWQPWTIPQGGRSRAARLVRRGARVPEPGLPIGFRVRIDTTAAGFAETPCYFAWLQGPLFDVPSSGAITVGVHWDHVDEAGPDGFTFYTGFFMSDLLGGARVARDSASRPFAGTMSDLLRRVRTEPFYVSWLAVTPADPACPAPGSIEDPEDPCADEVSDGHVH